MTCQIGEIFVFCGEDREIRVEPMAGCDRPVPKSDWLSTGCWRGYQGTWEVRGDALHLIRLGELGDARNGLNEMFPGNDGSVEATWFSGEISDDDVVIDPATRTIVEVEGEDARSAPALSFVLVIHRGKLLLEALTDWNTHTTRTRLTAHVAGLFPPPELEFLQNIHANLNDPAPKLVYADWLEERGDPRNRLLRAELANPAAIDARLRLKSEEPGWSLANGYIPPDDVQWFWRWLADIPDMTPEQLRWKKPRA